MMNVILYGAPVVPFAHELPSRLKTEWRILEVDDLSSTKDKTAAFAAADAVVAVDYGHDIPPAPRVKMIHVPGAGCDGIIDEALPPGAALCNVHKHEKGVAEFVIMAMLQWNIRYMEAVRSFRAGSWERSRVKMQGRVSSAIPRYAMEVITKQICPDQVPGGIG